MRTSSLIGVPVLGACLALGACAASAPGSSTGAATPPPPQPVPQPLPQPARCDAQAAQSLVGEPYAADTLARARAAAGVTEARVLRPGMAVTKEYKFGRLNVLLGEDGRVRAVTCG